MPERAQGFKSSRLSATERRRQIIEATISALADHGPQKCTLRQVAKDLEVAPSLINYFFKSWDELLMETYRALAARYRTEADELSHKVKAGDDPRAALQAYIDHYFSDYWTSDRIAGAYISLWALSRSEVELHGEMERFARTQQNDLVRLIASYAAEHRDAIDPERAAAAFYMLLSGLWYERAVNPGAVSRDRAKELAWYVLDSMISPARR